MKKFWIILLILLLIAALALVGMTFFRGPQTPEEILAAAREKMSEVNSMRFDMDMDMEVTVLNKTLEIGLVMNGEMTAEPTRVHGVMTMDMGDSQLVESELYMETEGSENVTYIGTEVAGATVWTTQRGEAVSGIGAEVQSNAMELLELVTILADTEPEQISETELAFRGEIPADKIQFALQTTGMIAQLQSSEIIDPDVLEEVSAKLEDMPVRITVDTEELVITGYELDMTGVIREIMLASVEKALDNLGLGLLADDLMSVAEVTTQMRLYGFDEVDSIEIPDDVKSG